MASAGLAVLFASVLILGEPTLVDSRGGSRLRPPLPGGARRGSLGTVIQDCGLRPTACTFNMRLTEDNKVLRIPVLSRWLIPLSLQMFDPLPAT